MWEYAEHLAQGGTQAWREAVLHAAELLARRTNWDERFGTLPPRECQFRATALLVYGIAADRGAAPTMIDGSEFAVWVASRSIVQGRNDLADLLSAAGHDVPEPGPVRGRDRDPVIAAWHGLVDDPRWIPAADVLTDIRTSPALPEAFSGIIWVFGDRV
ncbi:hypothetical protein [Micromonospora sp. Llam0]|uniref:hypothetical protein n=1 Tax=Micromonospora sp. Llam0 TaxID=2485143 RepID=UPI0011CE3C2B|nr:hypothetical protein [Micromonospora sp. Llam0]